MTQAGNGAVYIKQIIAQEVANRQAGRETTTSLPINLVVRARFNPNLDSGWFSSVMQVLNNVTLLTIILTGAALIREREQGTVEHLLVMPITPVEIMLAKMTANALVILVAAVASLVLVVEWALGVPIAGSLLLFVLGAAIYAFAVAALGILLGTLATTMGPVRSACHPGLRRHAAALPRDDADGEHADLAAMDHAGLFADAAFRRLFTRRALSRRRARRGLARDCEDRRDRRRLFRCRARPLPKGDLRVKPLRDEPQAIRRPCRRAVANRSGRGHRLWLG